ncbi:MAG: DUF92 domain-containing protein [Vicinamibacterales bacterium]
MHIAVGAFALLLRFLSWRQAAALATGALLFNALVLPRVGGRALLRPGERAGLAGTGIVFYPLAVLMLVIALRERLDLAAAAWAILAAGDGAATIVGRALGGPTWPWNRAKSLAGTAAFIAFGSLAAVGLLSWTNLDAAVSPTATFIVTASLLACVAAALVETVPMRLDDNLSVPAVAGIVLWLASRATAGAWSEHAALAVARWPWALAANGAMAALAYASRTVTPSGVVGGLLVGVAIFIGAGWQGWLMLVASFAVAVATSRLGLRKKAQLGIAEARGGRRGAGNAFGNCGVAAVAALAALVDPRPDLALLVLVTGLAAGSSDTAASEIGKAFGSHTFVVPTFRRVPPGTSGAVSVEGTIAGIGAALVLATFGAALGLVPASAVVPVAAGCTLAAFVESYLGATLEHGGTLTNDVLNFILTVVAAALALAFHGGLA